jgi:hypothetical protein
VERLYFRTKNAQRAKAMFVGLAVLNAVLTTLHLFFWPQRRAAALASAVAGIIYALAAWKGRPGRAELGPGGLYLSSKQTTIPYESLVSILPRPWGSDGMFIRTGEGKRFALAVADEDRFLTEVSKRSPQLQRSNSGLAIPGAPKLTTF